MLKLKLKKLFNYIKNNKKVSILFILSILLVFIGVSFALFNFDVNILGRRTVEISKCELSINFKENDNLSLVSDYPISDNEALNYEPRVITLKNNSTCENVYYTLTLDDICNTCSKDENNKCNINDKEYDCTSSNQLNKSVIKYQLVDKTTNEIVSGEDPSTMTVSDSLQIDQEKQYELRLWIKESATNNDLFVGGDTTIPKKYAASLKIEMESAVFSGIAIQTPPTKTTYVEGETFDRTGMVVVKTLDDGSTRTITGYTVSPDRALQQTDTGITITYQGKVVTQNITVQSRLASEQLINKVGTDGLVEITHPADATLQLGATTPITEYRYQGANPNNYVNFNGTDGDYRIIGVFPTDDGTGNITNRIKLIKTTVYGRNYWNNSNGEDSTNRWGEASLKTMLNDTYYNSLTNKELIDSVKYYLGGYNQYDSGTYTKETMYQYERKISGSTYYYSGNPTSWTGRIGLMYVSDYMYGTGECNQSSGYDYDATTCKTTNWLYLGSYEWTITEYSSVSSGAFCVASGGLVLSYLVYCNSYGVRPVQYLISEAVIIDGTGTIDNPYVFGSVE